MISNKPFIIVDLNSGRYLITDTGHEFYNLVPNPIDGKYYGYCPPYDDVDIRSLGGDVRKGKIEGVLVIYVQKVEGSNDREVIAFTDDATIYNSKQDGKKLGRTIVKGGQIVYCSYTIESSRMVMIKPETKKFRIKIADYNLYMFRRQRIYKGKYPDLDKKILSYIDEFYKYEVDDDFGFQLQIQNASDFVKYEETHLSEPMYVNSNGSIQVKKSAKISKCALKLADYCCEAEPSHVTFLTSKGCSYMEGHHLIPCTYENSEFFYKTYGVNIDCIENIVSLCPNCHRMIHFGSSEEKMKILEQLYLQRVSKLATIGLPLTFEELKKLYKL